MEINLSSGMSMDTKIRIPGGHVLMRDIKVGDKVIAWDGRVTEVTGVYPKGVLDCNKIVFADGRAAKCCDDHLWRVYGTPTGPGNWRILSTKLIKALLDNGESLYIDIIQPEDNGLRHGRLEDAYIDGSDIRRKIMFEYLNSGLDERMAYIRGVMDVLCRMGHYDELTVTLMDPIAAKLLQHYLWSVGCTVTITSSRRGHALSIYHPWPGRLFREPIDRKVADFLQYPGKMPEAGRLKIELISARPPEEMQCVSINHRDQLFVTSDYLVSHVYGGATHGC